MSSLATRSLTLPIFPIPSKRYQATHQGKFDFNYTSVNGERRKSVVATSSLQSQRAILCSLSFTHIVPSKARICAATMNFRCYATQTQTQTQTLERKASKIAKSPYAPVRGKVNGPKLEFGGGGPPNDNGGGGGDGGGGWGSSGGFFLFIFLMFLDYLKELDEKSQQRRHHDGYDQLLL